MSQRKKRRDIDKAIRHLMNYSGPNDEWMHRLEAVTDEFLLPIANAHSISIEEAGAFFMGEPYEHMMFGFAFEEYATVLWDGEPLSLVGEYLKQRGWRETSIGRRYLKALDESDLNFWEITKVKTDSYVDIRLYGSDDKPIRVKEKAATQNLYQWDAIAARVLKLDGNYMFTGAILPFKPDTAQLMKDALDEVSESTLIMMQQLIKEGELEDLPDDMEAIMQEEYESSLPGLAFQFWGMNAYAAIMDPIPELRNMDDEEIRISELHYPILGDRAVIAQLLNGSKQVDKSADENCWVWLPSSKESDSRDAQNNIREYIHGHIALTETRLQFETNSTERTERGRHFLNRLLGDLLGEPLTLHENPEMMTGDHESVKFLDDMTPEIQTIMIEHLNSHYLQTLDKSIPMLGAKTPRECAADPKLKAEVVKWLKTLENANEKSAQTSYDFSWMWDELNLTRD